MWQVHTSAIEISAWIVIRDRRRRDETAALRGCDLGRGLRVLETVAAGFIAVVGLCRVPLRVVWSD